jgi:hypothetical protein
MIDLQEQSVTQITVNVAGIMEKVINRHFCLQQPTEQPVSSSSPLCRIFTLIYLKQTMFLGYTVSQLFRAYC